MNKVFQYVLYDLLRTRFTIFYTVLLFVSTVAMVQLEADSEKVMISLINILIMVVPLFSIVFATIHFYNSYEFITLKVSQPVTRNSVFISEYLAVCLALVGAFLLGVGLPLLLLSGFQDGYALIFCGVMLTVTFVSLAFLASVLSNDKAKAIGFILGFWFYFVLLYDGLFLWLLFTFNEYPLERFSLILVSFNPIDLARIIILLRLDTAALMGYTGAFFKDFFGSEFGVFYTSIVLVLWTVIPFLAALRIFSKKDL